MQVSSIKSDPLSRDLSPEGGYSDYLASRRTAHVLCSSPVCLHTDKEGAGLVMVRRACHIEGFALLLENAELRRRSSTYKGGARPSPLVCSPFRSPKYHFAQAVGLEMALSPSTAAAMIGSYTRPGTPFLSELLLCTVCLPILTGFPSGLQQSCADGPRSSLWYLQPLRRPLEIRSTR